ncbi:hypothetical protein ACSX1A_16515 [Pontibacter sp. MBLB2868]|uniref:hypothetical protein n=1 Tax=Pontibacter sp. MBLB2868 TaxID=3451555 RepID=UPI003F74B5D3
MKKSNQKEKQHEPLTIDWLRTYPGYENISDVEAENTILTLRTLAQAAVRTLKEKQHE